MLVKRSSIKTNNIKFIAFHLVIIAILSITLSPNCFAANKIAVNIRAFGLPNGVTTNITLTKKGSETKLSKPISTNSTTTFYINPGWYEISATNFSNNEYQYIATLNNPYKFTGTNKNPSINIYYSKLIDLNILRQNAINHFIINYHTSNCDTDSCWKENSDSDDHKLGWWNTANLVEVFANYLNNETNAPDSINIQQYVEEEHTENTPTAIEEGSYNDDQLWWVLAYLRVYEVYYSRDIPSAEQYYSDAKEIFDNMLNSGIAWNDEYCEGGAWWSNHGQRDYKNAITNELFLAASAKLAKICYQNNENCTQKYLDWAEKEYNWFFNGAGKQLVHSNMLIDDGLNVDRNNNQCTPSNNSIMTYNQGVILGGLADFSIVESHFNPNLAAKAHTKAIQIANAAITSPTITRQMNPNGNQIAAEFCESLDNNNCNNNEMQFKGIFIRYLHYLTNSLDNSDFNKENYENFITNNVLSILQNNTNNNYQYGLYWTGPYSAQFTNANTNISALDAFISIQNLK